MATEESSGKYVPLDHVKGQLLRAAVEPLDERNIGPPHPVTLGDAIKRANVPRSSACRAFSVDGMEPQEAFTHELIRRVGGPAVSGKDQQRDRGLDMMLEVDDAGPEELALVFQEFIRLAGADFGQAMIDSSGAQLFTMALPDGIEVSDNDGYDQDCSTWTFIKQ